MSEVKTEKELLRERLLKDTADYLEQGGVVKTCAEGDMREFEPLSSRTRKRNKRPEPASLWSRWR